MGLNHQLKQEGKHMATHSNRELKDDLAKRSNRELKEIDDALNALRQWEMFESEYGCLRAMVSNERAERFSNIILTLNTVVELTEAGFDTIEMAEELTDAIYPRP